MKKLNGKQCRALSLTILLSAVRRMHTRKLMTKTQQSLSDPSADCSDCARFLPTVAVSIHTARPNVTIQFLRRFRRCEFGIMRAVTASTVAAIVLEIIGDQRKSAKD